MNTKFSISLPKNTVVEMKTFVDGVQVRNITHLVHLALVDWMNRNRVKGTQLTIENRKGKKNESKK